MIARCTAGDRLFQELCGLFPEAVNPVNPNKVHPLGDIDDKRLDYAVHRLLEEGFEQSSTDNGIHWTERRFYIRQSTVPDEDDWERWGYYGLGAKGPHYFTSNYDEYRGENGRLLVDRNILENARGQDSQVAGTRLIVPDRVKLAIESEFPEARFESIHLYDPRTDGRNPRLIDWEPGEERWWQPWSSVEFPEPSPRNRWWAPELEAPPPPGYTGNVTVLEDEDGLLAIRYRRSDIEAAGPYDIFLGQRPRWGGELDRGLIVSKRFWGWTLDQGLAFSRRFIRVDEE